jgi:hypothetical protein
MKLYVAEFFRSIVVCACLCGSNMARRSQQFDASNVPDRNVRPRVSSGTVVSRGIAPLLPIAEAIVPRDDDNDDDDNDDLQSIYCELRAIASSMFAVIDSRDNGLPLHPLDVERVFHQAERLPGLQHRMNSVANRLVAEGLRTQPAAFNNRPAFGAQ